MRQFVITEAQLKQLDIPLKRCLCAADVPLTDEERTALLKIVVEIKGAIGHQELQTT